MNGVTSKVTVKDLGWNEIVKEHKVLKNTTLKIGYFGDGQPDKNLAYRAAIHTFGIPEGIKVTPKMRKFLHSIGLHLKETTDKIIIPMRPFMQFAVDNGKEDLLRFIKNQYLLLIKNKITLKVFLDRVGQKHKDQIQKSLTKGEYKANHPITVLRKGSSKPLIDNGEMKNGVEYKVSQGDIE